MDCENFKVKFDNKLPISKRLFKSILTKRFELLLLLFCFFKYILQFNRILIKILGQIIIFNKLNIYKKDPLKLD